MDRKGKGAARWGRWMELLVLYAAVPVLFYRFAPRWALIPLLLAVSLYCLLRLLADPGFDRRRLWNAPAVPGAMRRAWPAMALATVLMVAGLAWDQPSALLYLPRQRPVLWGLILVLYPLLSVYPQELIYRAYFQHRYGELFPNRGVLIAVGGVVFGMHHAGFPGALAVVLATLGGWLFGRTYARSGSLAAAALEHAVYGWLIFTLGLGRYFYLGG